MDQADTAVDCHIHLYAGNCLARLIAQVGKLLLPLNSWNNTKHLFGTKSFFKHCLFIIHDSSMGVIHSNCGRVFVQGQLSYKPAWPITRPQFSHFILMQESMCQRSDRKSGVLGSIPGLATYFRFSLRFFKKGSCQLLAKVCALSTG